MDDLTQLLFCCRLGAPTRRSSRPDRGCPSRSSQDPLAPPNLLTPLIPILPISSKPNPTPPAPATAHPVSSVYSLAILKPKLTD